VREKYNWSLVAAETSAVYQEVLQEFQNSPWTEADSFPADEILAKTRLTTQGAQARYQDTSSDPYPFQDPWESPEQLVGSRYLHSPRQYLSSSPKPKPERVSEGVRWLDPEEGGLS